MPEDGREGLTTQEQLDRMYKELETANKPQARGKAVIKTVWRWFWNIIFYAIMLALLVIFINIQTMRESDTTPEVFGYSLNKVLSSSMAPTYPMGSILLGRNIAHKDDVPVGTVVRFRDVDGIRVVHRIIRTETDSAGQLYYVTKGDNLNNVEDPDPVSPDQVEAEIIYMLPEFLW